MNVLQAIGTADDSEVIIRRASERAGKIMHCKVLRMQGTVSSTGAQLYTVSIADIAHRTIVIHLDMWFKDWDPTDDLVVPDGPRGKYIGRQFDVAYELSAYKQVLKSGSKVELRYIDPTDGHSTHEFTYDHCEGRLEPYTYPIVAVRIDGEWVEPYQIDGVSELRI